MGNNPSSSESETGGTKSRVLLYLYRTWAVIVTEKWSRTRDRRRKSRNCDSLSDYGSNYSQYSFCSCSQCQRDDGFSSGCDSELFDSRSSMAPNSEESARIHQKFSFMDELISKEKQRPPIYNPEDYALLLKKWGRKPPNGGTSACLYSSQSLSSIDSDSTSANTTFRDYRNPMLISAGSEMTLRQFGTVSELLSKLKNDLRLSYPSFIQEFVADPLDGVILLLDLLRAIQLSQSGNGHNTTASNGTPKLPPSFQRKALLDELSCLQCLLICCQRYSESVRRLTASSAGLFTLSICIMSNVTKSRILALQLLTKALQPSSNGHCAVSEAMSTLRLRFGEPVRFRFLVGMLLSAGGQGDLLVTGLKFLNTFLDTAETSQKRLYIQAELEQAGFDIEAIKKSISINSSTAELIFEELDHWEKKNLDVESLLVRLQNVERENDTLRDKVLLLERRVQILQEEKGILISLEQCLKERCTELQEEVHSLKSDKSQKSSYISPKKKADSPQEDEGISSSERSLSPDDNDLQRESSVYEIFSCQSETLPLTSNKSSNDKKQQEEEEEDEETTIEEVMEELNNIINDQETEARKHEQKKRDLERKKIEEAQIASKIQMRVNIEDYIDDETEIVPTNLHPQPPRKTRSLVHLYIPAEDYDYNNKEFFFENETNFSSEEGSDSLLSTTNKYQMPRLESKIKRNGSKIKRSESFKHVTKTKLAKGNSFDGSFYYNTPVTTTYTPRDKPPCKSKSLDRIDDGLDSMVDIVVTDHKLETNLTRSISNVLVDKQRIFLPSRNEVSYYFPRIQEKKTNFLKRGHTNAGLYSGQIRDNSTIKSRELMMKSTRSGGKVTDLASGLY